MVSARGHLSRDAGNKRDLKFEIWYSSTHGVTAPPGLSLDSTASGTTGHSHPETCWSTPRPHGATHGSYETDSRSLFSHPSQCRPSALGRILRHPTSSKALVLGHRCPGRPLVRVVIPITQCVRQGVLSNRHLTPSGCHHRH